jgi:SET domain-containing protein
MGNMLSFINHSCTPNTKFVYNNESGLATLQAIRDIQPDEEILIVYFDPHASQEEKLQKSKAYGFLCGINCNCKHP